MPKFTRVSTADMFADAGQGQQIFQLNQEVAGLQEEIASLKTSGVSSSEKQQLEDKIKDLTRELAIQEGVQYLQFSRITRNPLQPRVIFPQREKEAFSHILKEEGQLDPVLVLSLTDEMRQQLTNYGNQGLFELSQPYFHIDRDYLLFDGERRWRSGESVLEKLKAVIMSPQDSVDLLEIQSRAASTTLHQKKFHDLELAQVLLSQINYRYPGLKSEFQESLDIEIPKALNTALAKLRKFEKVSELPLILSSDRQTQEQWLGELNLDAGGNAVMAVILSYQQNPSNISRNVFPLLKLPTDLKKAVWDEGLDSKKLRILGKLKGALLNCSESEATEIRLEITNRAIKENWSSSILEKNVQTLLTSHNPDGSATRSDIPKVVAPIQNINFNNTSPADLECCRQVLEQKLKEVMKLIKQAESTDKP